MKEHKEWLSEFRSFLEEQGEEPLRSVSQRILSQVHADLNPPLRRVLGKVFGIHVLVTAVLSLFCPQLGVGPFLLKGHGVWHIVMMKFGELGCAAFCGALFLGASTMLAIFLLRPEDLRIINRHRLLNVTLLVTISFMGLMLAGADADRLSYLFWILGATVTSWIILRTGSVLRLRPAA